MGHLSQKYCPKSGTLFVLKSVFPPMRGESECGMIVLNDNKPHRETMQTYQVKTSDEKDEMTERTRMSALIAARPGPLQDGLRAMLMIMPHVETVNQVSNASMATRTVAEHHPALVLLDASLTNDGIATIVETIKAKGPHSRCLVLANDVQQQREAYAAGADAALVLGCPAAKLFDIVERLLVEQKRTVLTSQ
jgi:CheY-like chemotaxis protein